MRNQKCERLIHPCKGIRSYSRTCHLKSSDLVLVAPHREEDVLLRDPEARAHHGLEVGLVAVLTETGHLARGRHLHAQLDIGTCGHTSVSVSGFGYKILTTCFLQGDHGGLRLDFVDFHLGALPFCPFAMPSLPNFHLP